MPHALTLVSHLLCPYVQRAAIALRERPSVRDAVVPEYRQHLHAFLRKHEAHLLTLAGGH